MVAKSLQFHQMRRLSPVFWNVCTTPLPRRKIFLFSCSPFRCSVTVQERFSPAAHSRSGSGRSRRVSTASWLFKACWPAVGKQMWRNLLRRENGPQEKTCNCWCEAFQRREGRSTGKVMTNGNLLQRYGKEAECGCFVDFVGFIYNPMRFIQRFSLLLPSKV